MENVILNQLLQMNLIGIYGILLAFAVRLLLRKAGSRYCYALWIIVFLNLMLPTVLTGSFSLIPKQLYQVGLTQDDAAAYGANSSSALADDISVRSEADVDVSGSLSGAEYYDLRNGAVDEVVDVTSDEGLGTASAATSYAAGFLKISGISSALDRIWNRAVSAVGGETLLTRSLMTVWILVMVILFIMEGVQYWKTRRRLEGLKRTETDEENHSVTLEGLETPLLFGFVNPTIYLPENLNEEERAYILRHELYHRRRKDYMIKAITLSISILYWYNPFVWAAFHCFGVDMELSCDEAVLLHADTDIRKAYAGSLLKYGALQNHYVLTSLTFGEPGLKVRIRHVLQFKKRGVIITAVAVMALALLAVGLLVRPAAEEESAEGDTAVEEADMTQETYGWGIEEESIIHNEAVVYEITDAYQYGEIAGNFVSEDIAYAAYHLEDARICVLSTHDAGESWQQAYIGAADEMDALGALYLSFLENGTGYLLYTSSPAAGLMTKVLYSSVDAGASFQMVGDITDSVHNYPQWMVFYDENMGMILTQYHGYDAYAYLTTDGGVTWEALDLDVPDAEGSSYVDGISLIRTNKAMDLWVMHLQAVFDDRVDIYLDSMGGWAVFAENGTATQTESGDEEDTAGNLTQKEELEQALLKADGEALTMETLLELVSGGYSALTEFDYFNCVNAVLEYDGGAGVIQIVNYWYTFALEYEGVAYTFRASYYKSDNSLDMLYLTDDAGTEDNFALYYTKEGSAGYIAALEDFRTYLQETAVKSSRSWSLESFPISVDLPDGYTLGAWNTAISYFSDSGATMSGGVLIEPVVYALQEGYEAYELVAEWQYYAGFFAVIDEGFWSWEGDTLVPGTFPRENHMSSEYVEMVDSTSKTAYLVEVEYDLYTAAGQAALEESGVDLDEIDTVSKYWYIIFVDEGSGATTGYCLGLAQNQFTKEEAIAIAQSVVFAE